MEWKTLYQLNVKYLRLDLYAHNIFSYANICDIINKQIHASGDCCATCLLLWLLQWAFLVQRRDRWSSSQYFSLLSNKVWINELCLRADIRIQKNRKELISNYGTICWKFIPWKASSIIIYLICTDSDICCY